MPFYRPARPQPPRGPEPPPPLRPWLAATVIAALLAAAALIAFTTGCPCRQARTTAAQAVELQEDLARCLVERHDRLPAWIRPDGCAEVLAPSPDGGTAHLLACPAGAEPTPPFPKDYQKSPEPAP